MGLKINVHVELVDTDTPVGAGDPALWTYSHGETIPSVPLEADTRRERARTAKENSVTAAALISRHLRVAAASIAEQAGMDIESFERIGTDEEE